MAAAAGGFGLGNGLLWAAPLTVWKLCVVATAAVVEFCFCRSICFISSLMCSAPCYSTFDGTCSGPTCTQLYTFQPSIRKSRLSLISSLVLHLGRSSCTQRCQLLCLVVQEAHAPTACGAAACGRVFTQAVTGIQSRLRSKQQRQQVHGSWPYNSKVCRRVPTSKENSGSGMH